MSRRRPRRGRRAARSLASPASAPIGLPPEFRVRMEDLLGDEIEPFLRAMSAPDSGLRVNTLKLSSERFRALAPFPVEPLDFPADGFRVSEEAGAGAHPFHAAGLYYLQDPGAMVVGAVPDLPPDPRVLDIAAAPGGKSTHLAARMAGRGVLVANDLHEGRAKELAGNLERWGARNAVVTAEAPARLVERWPGWFDVVVVDAPCSGESMFHKSVAARREWSSEAVTGCARRQSALLSEAVELVRPGGNLVYSTCTFSPEENEAVVARLLEEAPGWEIEVISGVPGATAGRPEWSEWSGASADPRLARTLRLWPHRVAGAGHFVASLRRASGSGVQAGSAGEGPGDSLPEPPADAARLWCDFADTELPRLSLPKGVLGSRGEEMYLVPPDCPPLHDLRVVRPGWWLGTARKGRFEPSHALAMAIPPEAAARTLPLDDDPGRVAAYLAGETLSAEGEDGWTLVVLKGFPLGWGKRTRGVLKNHYPKGLRRR